MNNEAFVEGKKKSNGKFIAIIIILLIAVLGLTGYICYDKGWIFNKKETTKNETKETKKERKLTKAEQEQFKERIEVINYLAESFPISDSTKIDNKTLFNYFLYANMKTNNHISLIADSFTSDEIEKLINKYLGNNFKVTNENIICTCKNVLYNYDNTTKTYTYNKNHPGHGGGLSTPRPTYYYFVSGKVIDDKEIIINANILYHSPVGDTYGPTRAYYKSIEDSNNHIPIIGNENDNSNENLELTDELYNSVKDKLPITTYKFEKDSDGYYNLISVTIK